MKKLFNLPILIGKILSFFRWSRNKRYSTKIDPKPIIRAFEASLFPLGQITQEYGEFAQTTAKQGIVDGQNGNPDANGGLSHAEKAMVQHQQHAAMQITNHAKKIRTDLQSHLQTAQHELANTTATAEEHKVLEDEKRQKIEKANRNTSGAGVSRRLKRKWGGPKGVLTGLGGLKRYWEEVLGHLEAQYQSMLDEYRHLPPVKRLVDHSLFIWSIIIALTGAEIWVNFSAFQNIGAGDNGLTNLIIGIGCAIGQAWGAKRLGAALCKKQHRKMWTFMVVTVVLCILVGASRLMMGETSDLTKAFFFIVNIGFAAVTVIIAYFHAKHSDFFSLQQQRKHLAENVDRINYQIERLKEADQKRREDIEEHYTYLAKMLDQAHHQQIEIKIKVYETCMKQLDSREEQAQQQLEASMQHALEEYRKLNEEARRRQGLSPVKRWHLPPYGNSSLGNAATILLLLTAGLMGCKPMPEATLEVMIDKTDSVNIQSVEPMLDYIQSFVIQDTLQKEWGETTINLSPIGETSTQSVLTVHLPASGYILLRNEQQHKKQLGRFRAELREALLVLTQSDYGMDHSYIHRNLYNRLLALQRHQGTRIVLCWSDLILNEPEANFYLYRDHPEQILQHKEDLIKAMTKDYHIPQMTGVKIVNIYQPSIVDDQLHEVAKRYFEDYWTSLGMQVEFKSNIPLPHTLVTSDHKIVK